MSICVEIPADTDLKQYFSELTKAGYHHLAVGVSVTNKPIADGGSWFFSNDPSSIWATSSTYPNRIWKAMVINGVFYGWDEIATTDYAVNKSGDTMKGNLNIETSNAVISLKDTNTNKIGRILEIENTLVLQAYNSSDPANIKQRRQLNLRNQTANADISNALILYDVDETGSSLGSYKIYGEHNKPTLTDLGITATTTELNYAVGVTSSIQDQLNAKAATITGGASTIAASNLTTNRALISNGSGKVAVSAATSTELGYLSGVTGLIQNQINGKAPTSHASTATTYGVSSASNYGHAMASSTTPKANGTAAVGSETAKFARGDHVHPLQTDVSGNAGSATKLKNARTITLSGDVTGSVSFDGNQNVTMTTTVADNSHNHTNIVAVWG